MPMKWFSNIILFMIVAACLFGVVRMGLYKVRVDKFMHSYNSLGFGMTDAEVQSLFKREFDFHCEYHHCKIAYMTRGYLGDKDPGYYDLKKIIEHRKDIPWIYGNAQFLFGQDRRLIAYSLNGETTEVHTTEGVFNGSAINDLDEPVFEKLVGNKRDTDAAQTDG